MRTKSKIKIDESKFTRGAWLTLALVVFFFIWSIGAILYFFTLPTDGWFTKPPATFGTPGFIYAQNLVGAPSALQPDDHLVAIQGHVLTTEVNDLSDLQAQWQVGNSIRYTVERGGAPIEVEAPLVQWQFVPAIKDLILQSGGIALSGMWLFFAITAFAFFKRPNDHAARALFIFATLFVTGSGLVPIYISSPSALVFPLATMISILTVVAAYTVLLPPTLLRFALVFPHPKPIVARRPWVEYIPYLIGLCVLPFFLLQLFIVGYAWTIFSIVGAIVILIHSAFTMRDALSRAQLLWGLWGFVLGMTMFLSTYLVTFGAVSGAWVNVVNVIAGLSSSVLGITLAIAILRYRLFDIGIIIRRTVTYAIIVTLLGAVFFSSVIVLQRIFAQFTNTGGNEIITVLSTLVIAALFVPLRNRIQDVIDKRFNRKKYDAQKVLEKFGETVRDETDLDKLTAELVNVVNETMQPKSISLWLKPEERTKRIK